MSFPRYLKYKDSGVDWLGEVPEHWATCSFRHCLEDLFNGITANQVEEAAGTVAVTRIETISYGAIDEERLGFIDEKDAREDRKVIHGDILFSNINSLSMIGNCAIYLSGRLLYAGMNLLIFRPKKSVVPKWLYWLVRSGLFRQVVESLAKPAINQASISQSAITSIVIAVPSEAEQFSIAVFLDHETEKIDALVAEQEKLIELLKEKRQAVISHAVTKGLNPHAKMKDSGIEWLGQVPEHWEVKRLKFLCDVQTGGKDTVDAVDDGEFPFFVRSQIVERINTSTFDCEAVLTAGDGVGVGKVFHYVEGKFDFHQRVYMMNNFRAVNGKFFFQYLACLFYRVALAGGAKSTVDSLRMPLFMNFPITVPPKDEQDSIVLFINTETTKFDALTATAERAIELLMERRSALISAAVTGKIDVHNSVIPAKAGIQNEEVAAL